MEKTKLGFEWTLETFIEKINAQIRKGLDEISRTAPGTDHPFIRRIYDQVYEYLENGGKRMHGVSLLLSYRVAGGCDENEILPVAAAFQLYHHHTLIHDDIYDEDLKRRGASTAHHAFSEYFFQSNGNGIESKKPGGKAVFASPSHRKGVMAGFAMGKIVHAIALEWIAGAAIPAAKAMEILKRINLHDLSDNAAQLKDVYHEGKHIPSPHESLEIAHAKTGLLFEAGVECACLLAGCGPALAQGLKDWISYTAQAYQLQDDLEDFAADSEKGKGRGIGTDLRTRKPTFILASAIERASDEERSIIETWLCDPASETSTAQIMRIIQNTRALDICQRKIMELIEKGAGALEIEGANISRKDREELVDFSKYYVSDRYWKRSLPQPVS